MDEGEQAIADVAQHTVAVLQSAAERDGHGRIKSLAEASADDVLNDFALDERAHLVRISLTVLHAPCDVAENVTLDIRRDLDERRKRAAVGHVRVDVVVPAVDHQLGAGGIQRALAGRQLRPAVDEGEHGEQQRVGRKLGNMPARRHSVEKALRLCAPHLVLRDRIRSDVPALHKLRDLPDLEWLQREVRE